MDIRESNIIEIRHSDIEDIVAIKNIYSQPSCYSGTLLHPFPSLLRWQKRLSELPENFHSLVAVALYKRNGFIIEGEARDYAFRAGEYVDAFIMANVKDA